MGWDTRFTFICVPCRFVSKHNGLCPTCGGSLRWMNNFLAPQKRDDKGWRKVELSVIVSESTLDLCSGWCCNVRWRSTTKMNLREYKAWVKKRLAHRKGAMPRRYFYNF